MMSCVQGIGFCKSGVILPKRARLKSVPCTTSRALVKLNATTSYPLFVPQLKGRQKRGVICVLGGKDDSEDEKQPWEASGKNMGNLKGQSIEDLLRQQIEKKEYYNGSGGKSPPRGGGGGSGGGNGYGDSGDETGKRILATIFVILVYIGFIDGVELIRLTNDYIKYLLHGKKSVRLKNAMYKWERFWKSLTEKVCEKFRLGMNTSTWFYCPKYRRLLQSCISSQNDTQ